MKNKRNQDRARRKRQQTRRYTRRVRRTFGPIDRPLTEDDKLGPDQSSAKYVSLTERSKIILLIERAKDLFDIRTTNGLFRINRPPTKDTVLELTDLIVNCWPRDWQVRPWSETDVCSLLLWGTHTPNTILRTLARTSLYADQILVTNPFTDILMFHPDSSPLVKPTDWPVTFANYATFIAMLEPWIRADIIGVVHNPIHFDLSLFNQLRAEAARKFESRSVSWRQQIVEETMVDTGVEQCLQVSVEDQEHLLELMPFPRGIKSRIRDDVNSVRKDDPIRAAIPVERLGSSQLTVTGTGMNYEHANLIATMNGASIFTDNKACAMHLHEEASEFQTPLQQAANAFSHVSLSFLNNVTADFAIGVRKDNRLQGFREYLRSLTKGLEFGTQTVGSESVRQFCDRLESEYATYKEEWKTIQNRLLVNSAVTILGSAVAASAPIMTGKLSLLGLLAPVGVVGQIKLLTNAVFARRRMERKPLGMLLQLDRATTT
jgi:hypothetical protein